MRKSLRGQVTPRGGKGFSLLPSGLFSRTLIWFPTSSYPIARISRISHISHPTASGQIGAAASIGRGSRAAAMAKSTAAMRNPLSGVRRAGATLDPSFPSGKPGMGKHGKSPILKGVFDRCCFRLLSSCFHVLIA